MTYTPVILDLVLPVAGIAEPVLNLPSSTALIGATLHHQVLPVQFSGSGNILSIGSSNGLSATVGFF